MKEDGNPYRAPQAALELEIADDSVLASRWRRLFGSLIDSTLVGVAWYLGSEAMYALGIDISNTAIDDSDGLDWSSWFTPALPDSAFGFAIFLLLQGALLFTRGQTIGKLLLGMRIANLAGQKADFSKIILLRELPLWVANIVVGIGTVYGLIDALFVFRADKRCLHDLIAQTKVIRSS